MVAYLGNWQSCPNPEQLEQYDVVVVAFAVTYTWAEAKNVCSETCVIEDPPICGNGGNPALIQQLHDMGKKVGAYIVWWSRYGG
jgi:O-succinylbenzoate synthase